jgi:hypothetical protein
VGSWGVSSHESDCGLDLLAVAEERYLRGVKFKTFHIKHVTEILRSHIVDEFAKESIGWKSLYIDFFYDYTFSYRFAHAVILVAECFAEYRQTGKYIFDDFSTEKAYKRKITEFIYTNKDLNALRTELQSILDPQHALYDSWEDSDSFNEWQAHICMLCETLAQAISEGGDGYE